MDEDRVPEWLWQLVAWGFPGILALIGVLAMSLALGAADPKPLGPLAWEASFDSASDIALWSAAPPPAIAPRFGPQGLSFKLAIPGAIGILTRPSPGTPFTFEVTGAQVDGPPGAMYGVVFDYHSRTDYAAVVLNNNGYLAAYRISADPREDWFPLQQWPHILLGADANRLRVDIREGQGVIRVNEEVLGSVSSTGVGAVGVISLARAPGQEVRFGWAKCWSP